MTANGGESAMMAKVRARLREMGIEQDAPGAEAAAPPDPAPPDSGERHPPAQREHSAFEADLIPDIVAEPDRDAGLDGLLAGLDILDAYTRWCGKSAPRSGNRREGIKVSCPNPAHVDRDPSAWLNRDKGLWVCGPCGMAGGDAYDIAAWRFLGPGSVPGYKADPSQFVKLRRWMGLELGWVERVSSGGVAYLDPVSEPESESPPESRRESDDAKQSEQTQPASAHVPGQASSGRQSMTNRPNGDEATCAPGAQAEPGALPGVPGSAPGESADLAPAPGLSLVFDAARDPDPDPDPEPDTPPPELDHEHILQGQSQTFLGEWMRVTSGDDLPSEYYFWEGLMALGMALGNDVTLADSPPVKGNLFVVLHGPTGVGKSRSISHLIRLLEKALPYDPDDEHNTGTYLVPSVGSAESLVDSFARSLPDPADANKTISYPVRGLIRFEELATLIGRAARTGNPLKPLLQDFYDSYSTITHLTRGHGMVRAEGHFASAITTTQPRAIRELLQQSDADSGFVNRWVFAMGPPAPAVAYGRPPIHVDTSAALLSAVRSWASTRPRMDFEPDALERWTAFFHATVEPAKRASDANLLTRADLLCKKLMLLFAANRRGSAVTLADVERVIAMWDYIFESYRMLSTEIGTGLMAAAARAIEVGATNFHRKKRKWPTKRDIRLQVRSHKIELDFLDRTIAAMVRLEALTELLDIPKGGGRTVTRYAVTDFLPTSKRPKSTFAATSDED